MIDSATGPLVSRDRYVTSWRCLCFVAQALMRGYTPPIVSAFLRFRCAICHCDTTHSTCALTASEQTSFWLPYQQIGVFFCWDCKNEPSYVFMDAASLRTGLYLHGCRMEPSKLETADSIEIRQSNQPWLAAQKPTSHMVYGYLQEDFFLRT
jgi:hypothetical protein